jgi:hypothetical protein
LIPSILIQSSLLVLPCCRLFTCPNTASMVGVSLTSLHLETLCEVDALQFIAVVSQCPLLETLAIYDDIPFPEVTEFNLVFVHCSYMAWFMWGCSC